MSTLVVPEVVNLHLTSVCNLQCKYCYAQYPEISRPPPRRDWPSIIALLAQTGVRRVNFAGGEPTLVRDLTSLLRTARARGLQTSIVSNGFKLTDEVIAECDVVALSLDSPDDATNDALGRASRSGSYAAFIATRAGRVHALGRPLKINTVVTRPNVQQDLRPLYRKLRPGKVKLLQFRRVAGENDLHADELTITSAEFDSFVGRHAELSEEGIWVQPEDETTLGSSYVMIDPEGRVFQSGPEGSYVRSRPILELGLLAAMAEAGGYDRSRFLDRGGALDVSAWRKS